MNVFQDNKNVQILTKINKKNYIGRLFNFVLGCFIIALSYNIFVASNNLVPGGVGGIAVILNNVLGIDNSTSILVINLFLLVLSYFLLGKEKTRATILGTILLPIFIKMTEHINVWIQVDTTQMFLMTVMGGICYGFGAGLVFKAGFTSGGTDIINQIIAKYAKMSMGQSMLLSDGLIVLSSAYFFGLDTMLYSIVMLYLISMVSDRIVLGVSANKMFYIITDKEEEVKEFILKRLHHGVTVMKATGGYKRKNENILMTVLPTSDYYELRRGIKHIDKDAFFIVTDSYEVFGGE